MTELVLEEEDGLSLSTQKVGFWDNSKYDWHLHLHNPEYKEGKYMLMSKIKVLLRSWKKLHNFSIFCS